MEADLWRFEKLAAQKGYDRVAGVDEVGRGPLAGPVVSAAVILPVDRHLDGIDDSKRIPATRRDRLYDQIYDQALAIGIGIVDPVEIDRINILNASLLSMAIAVDNLSPSPDYLLVDGKFCLPGFGDQRAIIKGDSRSISIAAASIVAKVTRDRLMQAYHCYYPQYEFDRHKGYPTQAHRAILAQYGRCPIHRQSFKGVCTQTQCQLRFEHWLRTETP